MVMENGQNREKINCCKWCFMQGVKSLLTFYCGGYNACIWNDRSGKDGNIKLWSEQNRAGGIKKDVC